MKINPKIKKELVTSTVLLLKVTRWILVASMIVCGLGTTAMLLKTISKLFN